MRGASTLRVILIDRPGIAHDALAELIQDVDGVELITDASPAVPHVVVVDDRRLDHGHRVAQDADARLIVVGVDDHPGFAVRARRLGAVWLAKERAASLLPVLLGGQGSGVSAPTGDDAAGRR